MTASHSPSGLDVCMPDRYDCTVNHGGYVFKISFLHFIQTIIYTRMDGKRAGQFKLKHPMSSKTPSQSLLINEVINHMAYLDSDTRKEQWT